MGQVSIVFFVIQPWNLSITCCFNAISLMIFGKDVTLGWEKSEYYLLSARPISFNTWGTYLVLMKKQCLDICDFCGIISFSKKQIKTQKRSWMQLNIDRARS